MRGIALSMLRLAVAGSVAFAAMIGSAGLLPASAAELPPSLEGEFFTAEHIPPPEYQSECDFDTGTGSASFVVSGTAIGPYPGTFTESVTLTFTLTEQTLPNYWVGELTSFSSEFQIDSAAGTVTGTKALDLAGIDNVAVCGRGAPVLGTIGDTENAIGPVTYQATIHVATGTFSDSGYARIGFNHTQVPEVNHIHFFEEFTESTGVLPVDTSGKSTGGGQILHDGEELGVSFGFEAKSALDANRLQGRCVVIDHDADIDVKCLDVTSYAQSGNSATFAGPATVDGTSTTYRISVTDNADPGVGADTFSITTGTGYSASGQLTAGNIRVHH